MYLRHGRVFRSICGSAVEEYRYIRGEGILDELIGRGIVVPTEDVDLAEAGLDAIPGVGMAVDWTTYISLRRRLPLSDWMSVGLLFLLSLGAIFYKLTGDTTHAWFAPRWHQVIGWIITRAAALLALEFERAAALRDRIVQLREQIGKRADEVEIEQAITGQGRTPFHRVSCRSPAEMRQKAPELRLDPARVWPKSRQHGPGWCSG